MQISHGQFLLVLAVFADYRSPLKLEPANSCAVSWVLHISEHVRPKKERGAAPGSPTLWRKSVNPCGA